MFVGAQRSFEASIAAIATRGRIVVTAALYAGKGNFLIRLPGAILICTVSETANTAMDLASLRRLVVEEYPSARLVVLFGSVARGNAMAWSDVDIGIGGCDFWEALKLGAAIGAVFGREPHVVELDTASDLLRWHIAREGLLVYEAKRGTWHEFRAQSIIRYLDLAPIVKLCAEGVRRRLAREGQAHG